MEQGTQEWLEARCGKVTASRFKDVMTEPRSKAAKERGDLSQTAESYLYEVVGEQLSGKPENKPVTKAMQWGTDHEPIARELYSKRYGVHVDEVGFVQWEDNELIGGSPDGLIGSDGGIEIKCSYVREHIRTVVNGCVPNEYFYQVHGSMLVTGRAYWDFVSYSPLIDDIDMALFRIRVERDEDVIEHLKSNLNWFCHKIETTLKEVKQCLRR